MVGKEKGSVTDPASGGAMAFARMPAFEDIELGDLGVKAGWLEFLTKAGSVRIPVVPLLMMMMSVLRHVMM